MSLTTPIPKEYAELKRYRDGTSGKIYLGYKSQGTVHAIDQEPNLPLPGFKVYVALYTSDLKPRMLYRMEGKLTENEDGSIEYSGLAHAGTHPICCFYRVDREQSGRRQYKRASIPKLLRVEKPKKDDKIKLPKYIYAAEDKSKKRIIDGKEEKYDYHHHADMYKHFFKLVAPPRGKAKAD